MKKTLLKIMLTLGCAVTLGAVTMDASAYYYRNYGYHRYYTGYHHNYYYSGHPGYYRTGYHAGRCGFWRHGVWYRTAC